MKDDVDWQKVRTITDFYLDIPPMEDMWILWFAVKPLKPTVLTGVPKLLTEEATANKVAWVRKHLGEDVPVICCQSKDKSLHMEPGDIIIDDWDKHQSVWEQKGGIWILHKSAEQSIQELVEKFDPTHEYHPHLLSISKKFSTHEESVDEDTVFDDVDESNYDPYSGSDFAMERDENI